MKSLKINRFHTLTAIFCLTIKLNKSIQFTAELNINMAVVYKPRGSMQFNYEGGPCCMAEIELPANSASAYRILKYVGRQYTL